MRRHKFDLSASVTDRAGLAGGSPAIDPLFVYDRLGAADQARSLSGAAASEAIVAGSRADRRDGTDLWAWFLQAGGSASTGQAATRRSAWMGDERDARQRGDPV